MCSILTSYLDSWIVGDDWRVTNPPDVVDSHEDKSAMKATTLRSFPFSLRICEAHISGLRTG